MTTQAGTGTERFTFTDPDGDTLDASINKSFGHLAVTLFATDADGELIGVRMPPEEWRRLVAVVNARLAAAGG